MADCQQTTDSELKDMVRELLETQSQMMKTQAEILTKIDSISAEVKQVGNRLAKAEKALESHQNGHPTGTLNAIEQHHQSILATICFNSFLNIAFYGIESKPAMTLDGLFRNFMFEVLRVDPDKAYTMSIHVQCLPKMSHADVHTPILVTFRSHKDVELIRQKAERCKDHLHSLGVWVKGSAFMEGYMWKIK